MTKKKTELKPCPFCGYMITVSTLKEIDGWGIRCPYCLNRLPDNFLNRQAK
jgi:uncharacterized Zn-finger protein